MRPNAIYSKSGKGVQEASGKTSLLKREHRVVLAAVDGRATLADVAQKSGSEYDADFQRLIMQLDKDGFIREVSSGTAASPAAAAARPAGKLDTAIDLDFSSLASSQKANTAPQPTRPPPPPPAPKAPAVDMAAKAAAERRAKEQESALHRARKDAEEKAQAERERQRGEAEALLRQIEEERKAREEAERRTREEMSRARQERDERASRAEERKQKQSEGPAETPPPRPQAATGSDKFADSLFADLEAFNQREEESRKQDEETERAKKEERLRKAREMEERRAREEEEQRKAEEKQLAREEGERRAKEEEERLARENEERERKFREEEDRRARESEERSRKAKEEAILAAKTRGDMASGESAPQDRRAKALKRGPGVAAAYRRQERNWGKPVTIALVVILGVALGALHVIPISTADYEKAAREALGQPVRVGSGRISP